MLKIDSMTPFIQILQGMGSSKKQFIPIPLEAVKSLTYLCITFFGHEILTLSLIITQPLQT